MGRDTAISTASLGSNSGILRAALANDALLAGKSSSSSVAECDDVATHSTSSLTIHHNHHLLLLHPHTQSTGSGLSIESGGRYTSTVILRGSATSSASSFAIGQQSGDSSDNEEPSGSRNSLESPSPAGLAVVYPADPSQSQSSSHASLPSTGDKMAPQSPLAPLPSSNAAKQPPPAKKITAIFRRRASADSAGSNGSNKATRGSSASTSGSARSLVDRLTGGLLAPFGSMAAVSPHSINAATPDAHQADLLAILETMRRPRRYAWKSPVLRDELYIADILMNGDTSSLEELKRQLSSRDSMTSCPASTCNSSASNESSADDLYASRVSAKMSSLPSIRASGTTLDVANSNKASTVQLSDGANSQSSVTAGSKAALSAGSSASRVELQNVVDGLSLLSLAVATTQPPTPLDRLSISINVVQPSPSGSDHAGEADARRTSADGVALAPRLPKRHMPTHAVEPVRSLSRHHLIKFNSCSTLFTVDSTLFKPTSSPKQLDITLKAVAYAIMSHLDRTYSYFTGLEAYESANKLRKTDCFSHRVLNSADLLSEKLHPVWQVRYIPDEVLTRPQVMPSPSFDEIHTFLKQVFRAADLDSEVGIIMLIYMERFLAATKIALHGVNCFRTILGALMLASKVWDDDSVWNVDFIAIMVDMELKDLNQLERWWLRKVNYDVSVRRGVFAKYWFELRELIEKLWGVRLEKSRRMRSDAAVAASKYSLDDGSGRDVQMQGARSRNSFARSTNNTGWQSSQRTVNSDGADMDDADRTGILTPVKPLTEEHLHRMSASTTYSQSRIRESFSQALCAQPLESNSSLFSWELNDSNSNAGKQPAPAVIKRQSYDSAATIKKSALIGAPEGQAHIAGASLIVGTDLQDFGWGGMNLRRSKSDNQFTPAVPAASVL